MLNKNDGTNFYQEVDVNINNLNTTGDELTVSDSIKSIYVKIEAARSGKINKNFCMYTPKAMDQGIHSFIYPFQKHLQAKHNGEAVGVIREAEHVIEFFPDASKEFMKIVDEIKTHSENSDGKNLVSAVKRLILTPEYNSDVYKGLGIANIFGDIYDSNMILELRAQDRDKGKVSIGGKSKEVYCSVCTSKVTPKHKHKKGNYYNDELCFYINNDLYLDHCGFVTTPADHLTGTQIVQDEVSDGLEVDIINYKLTNSVENSMNLNDLKTKAKDLDAVKKIIQDTFKDEEQAKIASDIYESNLKTSQPNHYLLTKDGVLNLKSVVGIHIALNLLEDLNDEDAEGKAYLKSTVERAKETLNIENTQEALQLLLDSKKVVEEVKKVELDPEKVEDSVDETASNLGLSATLKEELSLMLDEKLAKFAELKVEDADQSIKSKTLLEELVSLRTELHADSQAIETLKKDYSEALVSQITLLKGGKVSDTYATTLNTRTIEQLKITVEDLKEEVRSAVSAKEVVPTLEKKSEADIMVAVEDSLKPIETEVVKDPEEVVKEEAETKDVVDPTLVVEDSKEELSPKAWYQKRIGEVGLSLATKEYNLKFK